MSYGLPSERRTLRVGPSGLWLAAFRAFPRFAAGSGRLPILRSAYRLTAVGMGAGGGGNE